MYKEPTVNRFIGREKEIAYFKDWLDDTHASKILYFHDAAEEPERKGGIGKTYLLRYCADLARKRQDISVVTADFFNVGDRDCIFLAERVISSLQLLFPNWTPTAFLTALHRFREKTLPTEEGGLQIQRVLSTELARDIEHLEAHLSEAKTLLVFLDTFETIEQDPGPAVLRPRQTFPDTYQIPFIRFVIAGRNRLDEKHINWKDRIVEVVSVPVEPFDRQEMMAYMKGETISDISIEERQVAVLYARTEGRPILIGLVADVLNHRILELEKLLAVRQSDFEQYLVEQINYLENPLNWVILFMAHVSHRFNLDMLEYILKHVDLAESVQEISRETLVQALPQLSFVRQAGSGESFVLHDEMQRLVSRYCWPKHDADSRMRKAISRCMIEYYERELALLTSEPEQQVTTVELLYHKLYVDLNEGLMYFQEQIQRAIRFWQLIFARLLLLEAKKFRSTMSLVQQNSLQLNEARLLRQEENPVSIQVIETLESQADPLWMEQNKAEFLLEAGQCYHERSLFKEARAYFTRALDAVQDDKRLEAVILSFLGGVCRKQGQLADAVRFFEQSTAILKTLGNRSNYAATLSTIASVLEQQGKYEEAMRRCKIALRIREEAFEHKEAGELPIGYGLTTLGVIYLHSGNVLEAEVCFERAFDIYTRADYKAGLADIYNYFGQIELQKGNLGEARNWFIKDEQAASFDINVGQYISSLNKLGRISLVQGQVQEAISYLQRAIERARQVPNYFQLTESLIDLAKVMGQMQAETEVTTLLQQAAEIAEREEYEGLHAAIDLILAERVLHRISYSEAFHYLEEYCYHTLQHNVSGYSEAVRKITDALLDVPAEERSVIIQQLVDSWTSRELADRYPELIDACREVQEWSIE